MANKSLLVGITGGSGTGKTYFLKKLEGMFSPEQLCVISQDNYYKDLEFQKVDENGIANFDLPTAIDFSQFAKDLNSLLKGDVVTKEEYVFNNPEVTPKLLTFKPTPIIIVEGIFVNTFEEVSSLLDLKVFIDSHDLIKIKRRIYRDHRERGYDLDDVLYRYENHVLPSYESYVKPQRALADLVVNNNKSCDVAIDVLTAYFNSKMS